MMVRRPYPDPLLSLGPSGAGPGAVARFSLRQLDNPADITRLVIFDTWTCNPDRYPPPSVPRRPRVDNVFLTGEGATPGNVRLIAMDFTECFASSAKSLMAELAAITTIKNDNVYGLFPEFKPHVKIEHIRESVARLDALDRRVLSDIVRDLPSEWDFSAAGRQRLVDFLEQRARHLVDTIIDRLRSECWPGQSPF